MHVVEQVDWFLYVSPECTACQCGAGAAGDFA